jgi:hypothetical protein
MWVRRRASISRHETVHTVLGVRFDFSAPSRTLRAENGLSLLARLGRSAADPCWQAHTHFLIAESEFLYAIWNPASQYEIVDSRLSRHWVWAQETDGVVVLSHPIIAIEGVLDDLWWADIDLWDEAMEAKLEKYRSALWTLLNEFGVLPSERAVLGCTEVDEWLSRLRDCLALEDASQRRDCIRQWSLKVPLPDTYAFTEFSERLKWSLVAYVLGLHAQGALEDAGARQQVLAWLNGVQPFLGETLRVPRVV